MNRLDRLTAILIHLQTKRVVRAQELANRFNISLRTVYRDVRSLEEAGVPIGAEAGVGYFLTDYHLPPVMFTSAEAHALLLGSKLIERWADASVRTEFESALFKIKSVLKRTDQEQLTDLDAQVRVANPVVRPAYADDLLNTIQQAIVQHHVLAIQYHAVYQDAVTQREVEPVGLYHYSLGWHLIAFCRTRQDYRDFRVDRIRQLSDTSQRFARHERLSLQEYIARRKDKHMELPALAITIIFQKSVIRFIQEQKYMYGFQGEENLGDQVRMHFQTPYVEGLARWLLMFGTSATIEQPDSLQTLLQRLIEEMRVHYSQVPLTDSL